MHRVIICLVAFVSSYVTPSISFATTQNRPATNAQMEADLNKDLTLDWTPLSALEKRTCIDGRPAADFKGDII